MTSSGSEKSVRPDAMLNVSMAWRSALWMKCSRSNRSIGLSSDRRDWLFDPHRVRHPTTSYQGRTSYRSGTIHALCEFWTSTANDEASSATVSLDPPTRCSSHGPAPVAQGIERRFPNSVRVLHVGPP